MEHIIGFPGIFESRYVINRVAFDLGKLFGSDKSIPVYWYGLIIVSAMIIAYIYFVIRAKRTEGIIEDHSMNIVLFAIPIGIVGARAFYVLTNLSMYSSFKDAILGFRNGGLAIYGGIIFGAATIIVYCLIKKLNTLKVFDAVVPAVMIAQAVGRWGNFFNAEAYGSSKGVENFFLRMTIADAKAPYNIITVHPTFLYESLWNVLGFVLANLIYRKKKFDGQILCFYLFWYGLGRGFIELLRTDSCMIFEKFIKSDPLDVFGTSSGDGLKAFVYLSMLICIGSVVLYIFLRKRSTKESDELEELKTALVEGEQLAGDNETSETSLTEGGDDEYEDGEEGDDGYEEMDNAPENEPQKEELESNESEKQE